MFAEIGCESVFIANVILGHWALSCQPNWDNAGGIGSVTKKRPLQSWQEARWQEGALLVQGNLLRYSMFSSGPTKSHGEDEKS